MMQSVQSRPKFYNHEATTTTLSGDPSTFPLAAPSDCQRITLALSTQTLLNTIAACLPVPFSHHGLSSNGPDLENIPNPPNRTHYSIPPCGKVHRSAKTWTSSPIPRHRHPLCKANSTRPSLPSRARSTTTPSSQNKSRYKRSKRRRLSG